MRAWCAGGRGGGAERIERRSDGSEHGDEGCAHLCLSLCWRVRSAAVAAPARASSSSPPPGKEGVHGGAARF